ncbi:MAG TPA: DUF3040 domain-containing protein [Blastococcus sp.]|jgi:hypothetical protein|nr:DUF3040 domain-containing protein [Blastococcus sp.]
MLSERERQELALIEESLRDDSRLAASFLDVRKPPLHLRRRVVRAAIIAGLLIALSGLLLDAAGLVFQGALLAGGSYGWWAWRGKRSAARWIASAGPHADPGETNRST